ncbi:MAG: hypothetical protein HW388_1624 [Dehalococcoidia bacterium]|nr:hypothetical protein [Dehalococcoidia bacterium]
MDFEIHYTEEQQLFRAALRDWLEWHAPRNLNIPRDGRPLDPEAQEKLKEFRRKLGANGWLAPSWPREYGGGGLGPPLETVLREELRRLALPSVGDAPRWLSAMMVWGTPEQRLRYVPPALRGETISWQMFNEPDAGTDLASLRTQAVRDGSDWLITGEKSFITGRFDPDLLCTLAVTDPTRPPRLNLGIFMVDAHLPGITIRTQALLMGSERHVEMDNVRVPGNCLLGDPFAGWEIAQTILEGERGGFDSRLVDDGGTIKSVLQYLREQGQV